MFVCCRWWNGGRWGTAALCAGARKYYGDKGTPHTADRRNYRTTFWTRVDVDAILPTCIPNVHQPSGFPTKFLSRFVCVSLRTTWLCITTTQNCVRYRQLIQLKLSKCILADWFLTWAWDSSCTRSGNYEAYFHPYVWNLITNILTLSMPCMTDMSRLQILHQLMSSAVVWLQRAPVMAQLNTFLAQRSWVDERLVTVFDQLVWFYYVLVTCSAIFLILECI